MELQLLAVACNLGGTFVYSDLTPADSGVSTSLQKLSPFKTSVQMANITTPSRTT